MYQIQNGMLLVAVRYDSMAICLVKNIEKQYYGMCKEVDSIVKLFCVVVR